MQGLNSDLNNPFFSRNKTSSSVVLLAILCFLSICLTVKLVFGTIFPTEKLIVVSQGLALKKKKLLQSLISAFHCGGALPTQWPPRIRRKGVSSCPDLI